MTTISAPTRSRRTTRAALGATALVGALVLTGCSGSGSAGAGASPSAAPTAKLVDQKDVGPGLAGVGDLPKPASAWPAAGSDARHSGTSKATGPQTAAVRWKADLEGPVTAGPVIGVDGVILAPSDDGVLHALDPATGKELWTFDGGSKYGSEELSTSAAVLGDGMILWPGPDDTLYALSSLGKLRWKEKFAGMVLSPAVAGAHRVYVSDLAGHLTALEVTGLTHRLLWTLDIGGDSFASATVGPDGTIYATSTNELVAVRDLGAKGAVRWRLRSPKKIEVSNGVAPDGTVVLGTNNDNEYGVAPDGSIRWAVPLKNNTYSSSVVSPDGTAYFGDNNGRVWVLDSSTGKVRDTVLPEKSHAQSMYSQVVVDGSGNYFWVSTKGALYGYSGTDKQLWDLKLDSGSDSYPALGNDGTLYVGTSGGMLYAVGS